MFENSSSPALTFSGSLWSISSLLFLFIAVHHPGSLIVDFFLLATEYMALFWQMAINTPDRIIRQIHYEIP